ncbi:hypothetical protein S7335_3416 [Synechococcus sp. PCC 7335]|uniref:hypothetical protein n=1 Tax=Synechococcus sp. (strain ATCC 29403 / PCC 7335) TaxID=91464 RepID=UPI00017ED5D9|nr:hypothetical protein [Synechococcus sp. PCC 7335]EDX85713.1 hypothetical protein S7335_3416 [Synechococcus sp. PCC 7335]
MSLVNTSLLRSRQRDTDSKNYIQTQNNLVVVVQSVNTKSTKISRLEQLGLAIAATFMTVGCTESPIVGNLLNNENLAQAEVTQISSNPSTPSSIADAEPVEFEVCAAVDSWRRPTESEQEKQLSQNGRYAEALNSDHSESPSKMASSQFWDHRIISFTTYGLSARIEPISLAGLWTVEDQLWDCYEPEVTAEINEGDRAETWLLNQQITRLQWDGSSYVMIVEPVSTGMQVVQFERRDRSETLPLTVVSVSGQPIEVTSGDWQ